MTADLDTNVHLSGIQPSGDLHLGNYVGALKKWVELQNDGENFASVYMIADLHAITVPFVPAELRLKVRELLAWMLAAGLDPKKVHIFQQSENPDHAQLMWLLSCLMPMGWLERMTQYKEKSQKQGERSSVGLFAYPVLMAADILLYRSHKVPVGDDQVQHIELARDIARRFNTMFGEVFVEPQPAIEAQLARVMSLQDPTKKMSKSDENQNGVIRLKDTPDEIRSKVKRAVTDSGSEIVLSPEKPAVSQLIHLYAHFDKISPEVVVERYTGKQYGEFKADLAEVIVSELQPIQETFAELMQDQAYLDTVLEQGLAFARERSSAQLARVRDVMGLSRQ